jgi:hypothetical protein
MRLRFVALVCAALALAACIETPRSRLVGTIQLAPDARPALGSIEVVVSQVVVPVTEPARDGVNLPPIQRALAGYDVTGTRQARVPIINNALPTFDYPDDVLKATQQSFARLERAGFRVLPTVARSRSQEDIRAAEAASTADAVLFFNVSYALTASTPIRFYGSLALRPKSQALQKFRPRPNDSDPLDPGNPIFRKSFEVERSISSAATPEQVKAAFVSAAHELAIWAATEASALKSP